MHSHLLSSRSSWLNRQGTAGALRLAFLLFLPTARLPAGCTQSREVHANLPTAASCSGDPARLLPPPAPGTRGSVGRRSSAPLPPTTWFPLRCTAAWAWGTALPSSIEVCGGVLLGWWSVTHPRRPSLMFPQVWVLLALSWSRTRGCKAFWSRACSARRHGGSPQALHTPTPPNTLHREHFHAELGVGAQVERVLQSPSEAMSERRPLPTELVCLAPGAAGVGPEPAALGRGGRSGRGGREGRWGGTEVLFGD